MFKKISSPTPPRRATRAVLGEGRSEVRDARNIERQIADGREWVNAQCLRGQSHIV